MKINTYLVLVHLQNPDNALQVQVNSYSELSEEQIKQEVLAKLCIDSRILEQPNSVTFDKELDND